jgi:hypothetical protein
VRQFFLRGVFGLAVCTEIHYAQFAWQIAHNLPVAHMCGRSLGVRQGFRGRDSAHYNPYLSESDRLRAHCSGKPAGKRIGAFRGLAAESPVSGVKRRKGAIMISNSQFRLISKTTVRRGPSVKKNGVFSQRAPSPFVFTDTRYRCMRLIQTCFFGGLLVVKTSKL